MDQPDLYTILGVLPDAEDIVITAAYRALVQRYHPDRWTGDKTEAHDRMAAINQAYAVLSVKVRRAEYDKTASQSQQADFYEDEHDEYTQAFNSALTDLEDRWGIACEIFPDLAVLRARHHRISAALEFSFVTVMLETKTYGQRAEIAEHMELVFLQRFFGTNQDTLDYARKLIFNGFRDAAKDLNRLVEVMGSDVPADLFIARIDEKFNLNRVWEAQQKEQDNRNRLESLKKNFLANPDWVPYGEALAKAHGYKIRELPSHSFFKGAKYEVAAPAGDTTVFENGSAFCSWVKNALCASHAN